jgi:competence protein ComEA
MKRLLSALVIWFALSGAALAAVNINTATKEEPVSLKGIGEKRAQEILNYRKKNGNFKSVEDLEKVPGIGPGLMKQIRSELTVTGKTSLEKSADKGTQAKAAEPAKSKGASAKTTEAPKSDAMKSDTAKTLVADKTKTDEKKPATK